MSTPATMTPGAFYEHLAGPTVEACLATEALKLSLDAVTYSCDLEQLLKDGVRCECDEHRVCVLCEKLSFQKDALVHQHAQLLGLGAKAPPHIQGELDGGA